jgi:hypothetical protein
MPMGKSRRMSLLIRRHDLTAGSPIAPLFLRDSREGDAFG